MKIPFDHLLNYNIWANERLFDLLKNLSQDEYSENLGGSMGGVRGTAVHMYAAELIWFSRVEGESPDSLLPESDYPDWPTLYADWAMLQRKVEKMIANLDEDAIVEYSNTAGEKFSQPLWQIITHVVNHAQYHRGQIVTMLRQLEKKAGRAPMEIPSMDMIVYYR